MKTLDYDDEGFTKNARALIDSGEPFRIAVGGWKAKVLEPLLPTQGVAITGTVAAMIVALAALAVLGGVLVYAIHKGRPVKGGGTGKAGPFEGKVLIEVE